MRYRETFLKKAAGGACFALALALAAFLASSPLEWREDVAAVSAFIGRYAAYLMAIYVAAVAALVFFEERNPDRTISWLITLVFVPVLGIIAYIFLGPDFTRIRMRRMFKPPRSYPKADHIDWARSPEKVIALSTLAYRNSSSALFDRNTVELFTDGEPAFAAIMDALRGAKKYINIEYYIFSDDSLGREIAGILAERAAVGVTVRMLVDGVGSWKLGRRFMKEARGAGIEFHTFMPVSFPFFHSRLNYRNHRKIVVVDGEAAFTGGFNVGVDYLGEGPLGFWRDTNVMVTGEAVRALDEVFISDWKISCGEDIEPGTPSGGSSAARPGAFPAPVQIVPSGCGAWRSIKQMYFRMISEAQVRVWITTPYLIPGEAIMEALKTAALSGVDVRILIPRESDHFLSHWAGFSNIEELLRSGVRVWLYGKGFLHAKTMLMDDEAASVGTANLDNRSLEINFEVQAFIYDEEVCNAMASQFVADLADSEECVLREWENRGWMSKISESAGRLWSSQV
jgi:cardiolipin synthase